MCALTLIGEGGVGIDQSERANCTLLRDFVESLRGRNCCCLYCYSIIKPLKNERSKNSKWRIYRLQSYLLYFMHLPTTIPFSIGAVNLRRFVYFIFCIDQRNYVFLLEFNTSEHADFELLFALSKRIFSDISIFLKRIFLIFNHQIHN